MVAELRFQPLKRGTSLAVGLMVASCVGMIGDATPPQGAAPDLDVASVAGAEFACATPDVQDPGPAVPRRLTKAEYLRTIDDTLGVDLRDLAEQLPAEQAADGFLNNTATQVISLEHVETYAALAEEAVRRIPDLDAFVARYAPCVEFDAPCEEGFIATLGGLLLRRPPSAEERALLRPIFDVAEAERDTFSQAAGLVTTALLQSPRFLYRMESQTDERLDDHEIASRLSYLVWGSAPDPELHRASAAGELTTEAGFRAQLDRMLATPRAREHSMEFLRGWLDLARLRTLNTPLARDMLVETEAFFDLVAWEEAAPLPALFSTPVVFATPELARHYGFADPAPTLARYDTTSIAGRRGLLTQGAVLSAGGSSGSLVARGKFILEHFLCAEVPAPPPGVNDQRPEIKPGLSQRSHSEERIASPTCRGCHQAMDPLAYALTVFDPLGAPRSVDEAGNALDTSGVLFTPSRLDGAPYGSTDEFIDLLAKDERLRDCLLLKNAQFAWGRDLARVDACTLAGARTDAIAGGMTYMAIVRAIALQPSFRMIRTE